MTVDSVKDMPLSGDFTWTRAVTRNALIDNMYFGIVMVLAVSFVMSSRRATT